MTRYISRNTHAHDSKLVHSFVSQEWDDQRVFRGVVTLDPSLSMDVWKRLSMNTQAIEYREFPQKLHLRFIKALRRANDAESLVD